MIPLLRPRSCWLAPLALAVFAVAAPFGCKCKRETVALPPAPAPGAAQASATAPVSIEPPSLLSGAEVIGAEPQADEPLARAFEALRETAGSGNLSGLEARLDDASLRRLRPAGEPDAPLAVMATTLRARLEGPVRQVRFEGLRAILHVGEGNDLRALYFYLRGGRWRFDLTDSKPWSEPFPGTADPMNLPVPATAALAGLEGEGELEAVLATGAGDVHCTLDEVRAPRTVAHFASLARGLRASLRPQDAGTWQRRPFYEGLAFYRAVPGALIQAGCPTDTGRGHAGFQVADELHPELRHDRPGVLSMVHRGPNTASSQFAIQLGPAPWLDDRHSVFGVCRDLDLLDRISRAPDGSVRIREVRIQRRPARP